jgi:hypothetical protein
MNECVDVAHLVAQAREITKVLFLVSGQVVNKVRYNLPLVVFPVESRKDSWIRETLLKEAA